MIIRRVILGIIVAAAAALSAVAVYWVLPFFLRASREEAAVALVICGSGLLMAILFAVSVVASSREARRKVGRIWVDPPRGVHSDRW